MGRADPAGTAIAIVVVMNTNRRLGGLRSVETRRERDEMVEMNIPSDQRALWNRVKGTIKGATANDRFVAFQEYVEEHPGEVMASLQDDADAQVEAMIAAYNDVA